MNSKITARQLAFEYLRRLSEEFNPEEYINKFEQLESEFNQLLYSANNTKKSNICDFLSRFCPKCKGKNEK